jgi:hypothetical protein
MKIGNRPVSGLYFAGKAMNPQLNMVRRLMSDWVHGGLLYGILLLLCTPISANLFRMFFFEPPQNRHPESL